MLAASRAKGQAFFVIFGGVDLTFILSHATHGLQSVPFQDMEACVGVTQREIHNEIRGNLAIRSGTEDAASGDHKITTLQGVRFSNGHEPNASCGRDSEARV